MFTVSVDSLVVNQIYLNHCIANGRTLEPADHSHLICTVTGRAIEHFMWLKLLNTFIYITVPVINCLIVQVTTWFVMTMAAIKQPQWFFRLEIIKEAENIADTPWFDGTHGNFEAAGGNICPRTLIRVTLTASWHLLLIQAKANGISLWGLTMIFSCRLGFHQMLCTQHWAAIIPIFGNRVMAEIDVIANCENTALFAREEGDLTLLKVMHSTILHMPTCTYN